MKYKIIIDKNAEEEIIAVVHAPSFLTQQIENLVCSYQGNPLAEPRLEGVGHLARGERALERIDSYCNTFHSSTNENFRINANIHNFFAMRRLCPMISAKGFLIFVTICYLCIYSDVAKLIF